MKGKRPFVVGRRTRRGTLVVMVRDMPPPVRGPFTLRAVVRPAEESDLGRSSSP